MNFLSGLLICIAFLYSCYIFRLILAWRSKSDFAILKDSEIKLTVIVPARNEEHNISNLLSDLSWQTYSRLKFEVIVIDDASTDNTLEKVKDFKLEFPIFPLRYIKLQEDEGVNNHKKRAITCGVEAAKNDYIVTTDADCRVGSEWLSSIAGYLKNNPAKMILGPVKFLDDGTWFGAFQQLEFSSLIGVTAATARMGHPLMCNGANMAYLKEAFKQVGGYGDEQFASGDDMFLMHKIEKEFPKCIHFIKSSQAIVSTLPQDNVADFLNQRKRWVSKNRFLPDWYTLIVGALTYAASISIVIYFSLLLIFNYPGWNFFIIAVILKFIADFSFLYIISNFFELRNKLKFIPISFIVNLIYVSFILVYAVLNRNYIWKDRKVN